MRRTGQTSLGVGGVRKPAVFLETSVLSSLHYRGGIVENISRQITTQEWWDSERRYFSLFASTITERELQQGAFRSQKAALAEVRRLPYLTVDGEVLRLASEYMERNLIPKGKDGDALQLAIAVQHKVDYLLSWNYAHLVKTEVQTKLLEMNALLRCRTPWLVSPESIPRVALGQQIRRRDRT